VGKSVKSAAKQERLAAALRENLKRRKSKDRAVSTDGAQAPAAPVGAPPARLKKASKID